MNVTNFLDPTTFDASELRVSSRNYNNRERINISYGPQYKSIGFVTPPTKTQYPRLSGSGNYREGSMYGPTSIDKASFQIDLMNVPIDNDKPNERFSHFLQVIDSIDDALLDYVYNNQRKILNRNNLTREEVRMLQIRSVRQRRDPYTGQLGALVLNLSAKINYYDQVGNKRQRTIPLCDATGSVVEPGTTDVYPGDIVSCTMQLLDVYTGVGGDKFGMQWQVNEVCIVAPAANQTHTNVQAFAAQNFVAEPYATNFPSLTAQGAFS